MSPRTEGRTTAAAIDLGSNSFHMVIARLGAHDLHIVDRLKEPVRLADGLDDENRLTDEAWQRAIDCLARFGERVRHIPKGRVRAVGTNTMRRARNAAAFALAAEEALGHPVEVVSGNEEARLIYQGVSHSVPMGEAKRLVVDIGGGSTEVIVGQGHEILRGHSLFMGCVTSTRAHFPDGRIERGFFREAETAAALELQPILSGLKEAASSEAIGASGTINAISGILAANGWGGPVITRDGLKKLRQALVRIGSTDQASLPGLRPDRAVVLPGGLAILMALFRRLRIETMTTSPGALREGVLYDLVGRLHHEDVRDRTIRRLMDQYHADAAQAERVEKTALALARRAAKAWGLRRDEASRFLSWAARLHEIGLAVSYTGHHRHGAYLTRYSDMPGFSADDQRLLAILIASHRRRFRPAIFDDLSPARRAIAMRMAVLLRLAVLLNRSRTPEVVPVVDVLPDGAGLELRFSKTWWKEHPLAVADLAREASWLAGAGIRLEIRAGRRVVPA